MTQNQLSSLAGPSLEQGALPPYCQSLRSSSSDAWFLPSRSFVVSNVGEFSRTILGSHFKHNNVSCLFHVSALPLSLLTLFPPFVLIPPFIACTSLVLELRPAIEHVRVPQDQPYSSCPTHVYRRADLGVFSPQIPSRTS